MEELQLNSILRIGFSIILAFDNSKQAMFIMNGGSILVSIRFKNGE